MIVVNFNLGLGFLAFFDGSEGRFQELELEFLVIVVFGDKREM